MILEGEGLVVSRSDGRYVIELTENDVRDIHELRWTLERLAAERAAANVNEGNRSVLNDRLDAMAAAGIRFDRFYSAHPMCSPTRASCLTGRSPTRYLCMTWGHDLPLREVTIAEAVRTAGYTTAHFGKWHVGGIPHAAGGTARGVLDGPGSVRERLRSYLLGLVTEPDGRGCFIVNTACERSFEDAESRAMASAAMDATIGVLEDAMRSAGIAAPGSAAATTSASRP